MDLSDIIVIVKLIVMIVILCIFQFRTMDNSSPEYTFYKLHDRRNGWIFPSGVSSFQSNVISNSPSLDLFLFFII